MQKHFYARLIGPLVVNQLVDSCIFTIRGNTSRGIFLESASGDILFLSFEEYAGPLTVNVPEEIKKLVSDLEPGEDRIDLVNGDLVFERIKLRIAVNNSKVWKTPPIPGSISFESLKNTIHELMKLSFSSPYAGSLYQEVARSLSTDSYVSSQEPGMSIGMLHRAIRSGDADAMIASAGKLAGLGHGLTPAGDDLLIGLILTANRYQSLIPELIPFIEICKQIPGLIAQKSTRLSYAISRAALQGLADERILAGLDNLAAGNSGLDILMCISGYGASSGMDTLAGALLLFNK